MCHPGHPGRKDLILISVKVDGRYMDAMYGDGGSTCNDLTTRPWDKVLPARDWDYYND